MQNWLIIAFGAAVYYSFKSGPGILIPIGIVLDGYYGNFYTTPYLSLVAVLWYAIISYIEPRWLRNSLLRHE